jgi:hypothetical protein
MRPFSRAGTMLNYAQPDPARRSRVGIALATVGAAGVAAVIVGVLGWRMLSSQLSNGPTPADIGPSRHQMGRPAEWRLQRMPLGDTGYVAAVGPEFYQDDGNDDPDYYRIDVEKGNASASYVLFQRDFTIDEIPKTLTDKPISQIIAFDARSRTVTFQIGDRQERYRLPN